MKYRAFSKIWILIIFIALIGGGILAWQYFGGISKNIQKLTEEQIKAVDYNINNPDFQQGKQPDYGFYLIKEGTYYKTPIVWGDLNNDGKEDAVVVLNQGSVGSAVGVLIGAVINDKGKAKFIDFEDLGDRTQLNNIKIENGIITIDMLIKGPNDPGCCPSVAKKTEYKLLENKIKEITSRPADETANWKTYSGSEVNFTFKYPSDWEIKEEYQYKSAACQMDSTCEGVHYIFLNKINDPREAKMGEKDKFGIVINMPQCTGVRWGDLLGNNWICVFDEEPEVLSIYEQIKKSFQLIEDETIDWKTYKNEEYGFEMKYPKDWDYTILGMPNTPIMFASANIITKTKQSIANIENDKSFTLWITIYDKTLFEGGILPYRGKSNEYIKVTASDIDVGGTRGAYYISEYLKDKGSYKAGDKTVTLDLLIEDNYLSMNLFDYQYANIFEKMLSTFRFLE